MKLLLENWRQYLDEVEDFPDITNDQGEIQQSLDYFYKDHAPSKGTRSEAGQLFGYSVVRFDLEGGDVFYFLVDNKDIPKAYVALSPLEDGMQVGNVRKTKGDFYITDLYKWLIDQHNVLYSDTKQTTAGQGIWSKLREDPELSVEETDLSGNPWKAIKMSDIEPLKLPKYDPETRKRFHRQQSQKRRLAVHIQQRLRRAKDREK